MSTKDKNSALKVERKTETEEKNNSLTVVNDEKKNNDNPLKLSFSERMKHIKNLQGLTAKLEQLEATEIKLKNFELDSDGMNDHLIIRDSNRNEFSTSNSEVIKVVFNLIQETVSSKQTELKNLIAAFSF